jgi:ubiquinone biosynthesis protein Coq4
MPQGYARGAVPIVNSKSNEINDLAFKMAAMNLRILLLKVIRKVCITLVIHLRESSPQLTWSIVSSIRLGKQTKVTILVLREELEESLK